MLRQLCAMLTTTMVGCTTLPRNECFTCHQLLDSNKNGLIDPDEAIGRRTSFAEGDRVTFVGRFAYAQGQQATLLITDSQGRDIHSENFLISQSDFYCWYWIAVGLSPGHYTARWLLNNKPLMSHDLFITGAPLP